TRYQRTGNLQDLEAAITRSEAAVEAIPEDHPTQAALLTNLGSQLNCRYERIGNLQDLEAAIARTEAALARTPEDHPNRVSLWNNLGIFLGSRYARTGNLPDLEVSITRSTAALEVTPETHPDRARRLTNLGNRLSMQYQRTRNPQDLEAAISRSEAAVEATPEVHPDRAGRLINLGNMLGMQYQRTRNLQDLEAAIATSEAAVKATPEGHPNQAKCLNCLGLYLSNRYERTGNMQDSTAAISAYLASWSTRTAPILTRLEAALNAAKILVFNPSVKDLPRASSLLSDAIHLMPLVTSRSLVREDQQHILGQLTGLASLAVAVSLEVGQSPLEALRLQELGRNITNGQLIDYRSEIWDLIEQHPMLAEDFDSLRQELDSPLPATKSSDMSANQYLQTLEASICRRNKVAQDLDDLILKIRQKPGFENFLLAVSTESLLLAADKGPIVVLNITELRSDAILLTKAHVTSIALTNASHAAMIKYFGIDAVTDNNKVKRELLEWLWKGIVQPVLRELGFYPAPKDLNSGAAGVDVLPRIWWVGVGLMAKAPIHAAAKFKNGRIQTTTIQYCLPSYTSTIKALQYSRSRQRQQRQSASAVIVTMPTTPGASSLPGVIKESDDIKRSLGDFTVDILERPTAECVLQALPNYSIAHFACHGVSSVNPAESHLLLTKKSVLHEEVDKLCVKDVAALKLPAARLAYLSACSTANTTSPKLVDEVTHIVSSFHIAGFIHVIGTLWHSEDQACQKMAVDFYAILNKTDNVAVSYRTALMGLMKQKPLQPMYWAPFIHFGA
ncbi:CHAT domain-containing protein, partial [Tirmania nivea]